MDVKKKSFTRDVLYGVGYAGLETPPTGYLCFYDSDVEWDWTGSFNYANVSVHQAAGFVANTFLAVAEVDDTGKPTQTFPLNRWSWKVKTEKTNSSGLAAVSLYTTSEIGKDFQFIVTFIMTSRTGVLNVGGAVVNPLAMETIVEIDNFPYKNASTGRVALLMGAAC